MKHFINVYKLIYIYSDYKINFDLNDYIKLKIIILLFII